MWDVAVIGAGLSGIICARRLVSAGYSVCILDKSRGLGGRMATRRVGDRIRVDHGLRYWRAASERAQSLTADLVQAGVLKPWRASEYEIQTKGEQTLIENIAPKYVAELGMSAVAKHLLQQTDASGLPAFERGKNLLTQHRAVKLSRRGDLWTIECETGERVQAKRCVIAIPAQQAADLLERDRAIGSDTERLSDPIAQGIQCLRAVTYLPCLTVMAGYAPAQRAEMGELDPQGWMVSDRVGTSTEWVGLDSSKRDRTDGPVIVIHSKPKFARRYLESNDLQPAASVLLRANARRLFDWIAQPEWFQIHRWRYAHVQTPYPKALLAVGDALVCGGDWCVDASASPSLESIDYAFLSGLSLAQHLQSI